MVWCKLWKNRHISSCLDGLSDWCCNPRRESGWQPEDIIRDMQTADQETRSDCHCLLSFQQKWNFEVSWLAILQTPKLVYGSLWSLTFVLIFFFFHKSYQTLLLWNLTPVVSCLACSTAQALRLQQITLESLACESLHNRIALDYLFAEQKVYVQCPTHHGLGWVWA